MYVITRQLTIKPDAHEAMRAHWENTVLPVIQQQAGYSAAYMMQSDDSAMIVLLWEDAAAYQTWHDSAEHEALDGWMKDYAAKFPIQKETYDRVYDYR